MNPEILTLSKIKKYCERQSGRTTAIFNDILNKGLVEKKQFGVLLPNRPSLDIYRNLFLDHGVSVSVLNQQRIEFGPFKSTLIPLFKDRNYIGIKFDEIYIECPEFLFDQGTELSDFLVNLFPSISILK